MGTLWVWLRLLVLAAAIMAGFAVGPIIVEERAKQRRELLLATPISVEQALLGKVAAARWWIRYLINTLAAILLFLAAGIGMISLILISTNLDQIDDLPIFYLCGAALLLPIIAAAAFVVDRIQQYLVMVAAATAVSVPSSSMRTAFATAAAAVLVVWSTEFVFAGTLMALQAGATRLSDAPYMLALAALGPVVGYILELSLGHAALYAFGALVVREIVLNTLWRWSLRKAR